MNVQDDMLCLLWLTLLLANLCRLPFSLQSLPCSFTDDPFSGEFASPIFLNIKGLQDTAESASLHLEGDWGD